MKSIDNWNTRAECLNYDPDMWSVTRHDRLTRLNLIAIAVCRTCPVRAECRQNAESPPRFSNAAMIYGGRVYSERYLKGYRVMTTAEVARFINVMSTTRHNAILRTPQPVVK